MSLILVASLVVAIIVFFYGFFGDLGPVRHSLFAILFSIVLLFVLTRQNSWLEKVLSNKYLVWVGSISYSLYLFHYLFLGVTHHVFGNLGIGIRNVFDIFVTVLALFISVLMAWVIYEKVETPVMMFGRRYKYN